MNTTQLTRNLLNDIAETNPQLSQHCDRLLSLPDDAMQKGFVQLVQTLRRVSLEF